MQIMRKMKDSGIEWIGEIPEGWEVAPLKRFAFIQTGNTPTKTSDSNYYASTGIPWIKPDNLGYSHSISKTSEYLTSEGALCARIMPPNTVYVCCIGSLGKVGYSSISCACNQQINALIFNDLMFWKYGYYLTIAQESQYLLFGNGNVLQIINSTSQGNIACVLPPLENQHLIACYLDSVYSDIEILIAKARSSIEEYKKLKQAVITQAVIKGVRGEREMKDSGVEWIGEIPKYWNIGKLKYYWISVESGVSVNAADRPIDNPAQYGVLKTSSVSKFIFNPHEHKQVNNDEYSRVTCPVTADCIIVSRMNTPDLVGACGYVEKTYPNLILPDRLWQISFKNDVSAKFIWYYLNNKMVRSYISSLSTGTSSTMQNISQGQFGNISVCLPDSNEQKEIADYLDAKCAEIDGLIAKKEQLVKELESYKKSLIYEVVTGKREV